MREEDEFKQVFTPDLIEKMVYIWTRSSISLTDVRHQHIDPGYPLERYRMPSNVLVYAYGGSANVQLNQTMFNMERFGIFHGGKGTTLSILPDAVTLGSFMVFYKAETPSFFKKDLQRLLEQVNPFVQLYGFAPSNPVGLMSLFQQMMDSWSRVTVLNHFQAKNLLYQSMHHIYGDLERNEAIFLQPDPVISTKRYLDEHYMHPITFQEIADLFAISRGQLTRLFKKSEGVSLQEYLTLKRLEAVRSFLLSTNATVKEIAPGCGLVDEKHLIRIFRRHYGMTPSEYRNKRTPAMHGLGVDNNSQRFYNERGLEHLAKSQRDGELTMFGQARSKQMIMAAAMSLMLLLSACGTAPASNNGPGTQNTPTPAATTQTPAAATKAEAAFPRTYMDATGKEVVIEKQPERVALLHFKDFEYFYALGVTPVATIRSEAIINDWATLEPLRNEKVVDLGGPPNLEKLLEANPDLIIGIYGAHGEIWQEVAQIAPVLELKATSSRFDILVEVGKVLGKEEEAEKLLAEIKQKLDEAREQLDSVTGTVIIMQGWDDGKNGGIAGMNHSAFYDSKEGLALEAPAELPEIFEQISLEGLTALNPDHIFYRATRQDEYDQAIAELAKSTVWNSLTAVKNDQVHRLEESLYVAGPLGTPIMADYVVEKLVK